MLPLNIMQMRRICGPFGLQFNNEMISYYRELYLLIYINYLGRYPSPRVYGGVKEAVPYLTFFQYEEGVWPQERTYRSHAVGTNAILLALDSGAT